MRKYLSILPLLVLSCAPAESNESIGSSALSVLANSPITRTTPPLPENEICYSATSKIKGWPVDRAISLWRNPSWKLVKDSDNCLAEVKFTGKRTKAFAGEASFGYSSILITVDLNAPKSWRMHLLCHEIGHVLGRPHSKEKSCMNDYAVISKPSKKDLQAVTNLQEWSVDLAWESVNKSHK